MNYESGPRQPHHSAKLTKDQACLAQDYYAEGYTQKSIAEKFSVSPSTIHKLVHAKTWRWINDYGSLEAPTHTEDTDR